MKNWNEIVDILYSSNHKLAYETTKELIVLCEHSATMYPYMQEYLHMVKHSNSYIRTRGLLLLTANAKWDQENFINTYLQEILCLLHDEKPITVRQCLKALPNLVSEKPELKEDVIKAIKQMNTIYQPSMQPLIYKDRQYAITKIKQKTMDCWDEC